jgi:hypothetical protein
MRDRPKARFPFADVEYQMDFEKMTYPESIIIKGTAHKGKRNMHKGQVLIPYTRAPDVGVGDVIAQKAGHKKILLKVTDAAFLDGGSLGVGTEHPHLLVLKVVNTTAPAQTPAKQSSKTSVGSPPRKIITVRRPRPQDAQPKPQSPVKPLAQRLGEEQTTTSMQTNKHGFQRRVSETHFEGKLRRREVTETLASLELPPVADFRSTPPVGIPPAGVRTVELVRRSETLLVEGFQSTKSEYFYKFTHRPVWEKVREETHVGDTLVNVKEFHGNGQIKGDYQYLRHDPRVVKCILSRSGGTKEREITTWYRKDGTKARVRETTFDEDGNQKGQATKTFDPDGKPIPEQSMDRGDT